MDAVKSEMMGQLAKQALGSDEMEAIAEIVAAQEAELLKEVAKLQEAVEGERRIDVPDVKERTETLVMIAEAMISGNAEQLFRTKFLDQHFKNPDRAAGYIGIDAEDWDDQIRTWADTYREQAGGLSDWTDRQIAELHVKDTFGVTLDRFEEEVVNFYPGEFTEDAATNNFTSAVITIRELRKEVEDGNETD